jgi:hypothetical protein
MGLLMKASVAIDGSKFKAVTTVIGISRERRWSGAGLSLRRVWRYLNLLDTDGTRKNTGEAFVQFLLCKNRPNVVVRRHLQSMPSLSDVSV